MAAFCCAAASVPVGTFSEDWKAASLHAWRQLASSQPLAAISAATSPTVNISARASAAAAEPSAAGAGAAAAQPSAAGAGAAGAAVPSCSSRPRAPCGGGERGTVSYGTFGKLVPGVAPWQKLPRQGVTAALRRQAGGGAVAVAPGPCGSGRSLPLIAGGPLPLCSIPPAHLDGELGQQGENARGRQAPPHPAGLQGLWTRCGGCI